MHNGLSDRPVFICGHPKSGTSLVRSLLDSHPQLVVYPEETLFFRRFLPQARGLGLDEKLALADRLLIHLFEWNLIDPPPHQAGMLDRDYTDVSYEAVRQAMRDRIAEQYRHDGDLLCAAVLAFGEVSGQLTERTTRWAEKTPYTEHAAEQILTWWPEALFIHVVRDPRDNYLSYRRKHPEWSPATFGVSWSRSTRAGLTHQKAYGRGRYWVLRYEQLTHSPEETLEAMRQFVGIADHPILRTPTRNGKAWRGNSMFGEQFQEISAASSGRWTKSMSADDLAVLEGLARRPMLEMGYEPSGARLTHASPGAVWRYAKTSLKQKLIRDRR
jgi:hypothetical protein